MHERITGLRQQMDQQGWQAVFIPPGHNFTYFTGGFTPLPDERPCFLGVRSDRLGVLLPGLNAAQARREMAGGGDDLPMFTYGDEDDPAAALGELVSHLWPTDPAGTTGTDTKGERETSGSSNPAAPVIGVTGGMRADFLLLLQAQRRLTSASWRRAETVISPLRQRKSAGEAARLRDAASLADAAMEQAFKAMQSGMSEQDVAQIVAAKFREDGAEEVLFTLIASGPGSADPHYHTSDRILQAGDPVMLDIGCRLDGYCSDITRMAYLGEPDENYLVVHETVERAVQVAMEAAVPGNTLADVDRAARNVITDAGYGGRFVHRTGHGVGLDYHEPPSVHGNNETEIRPGMVFTIEPGIYLPDRFGVRLEEVVVVGEQGAARLSGLPRSLRVVAT